MAPKLLTPGSHFIEIDYTQVCRIRITMLLTFAVCYVIFCGQGTSR